GAHAPQNGQSGLDAFRGESSEAEPQSRGLALHNGKMPSGQVCHAFPLTTKQQRRGIEAARQPYPEIHAAFRPPPVAYCLKVLLRTTLPVLSSSFSVGSDFPS